MNPDADRGNTGKKHKESARACVSRWRRFHFVRILFRADFILRLFCLRDPCSCCLLRLLRDPLQPRFTPPSPDPLQPRFPSPSREPLQPRFTLPSPGPLTAAVYSAFSGTLTAAVYSAFSGMLTVAMYSTSSGTEMPGSETVTSACCPCSSRPRRKWHRAMPTSIFCRSPVASET